MIRKLMLILLFACFIFSGAAADRGNMSSILGDPFANVKVELADEHPEVFNEPKEISRSTEYTLMVYLCGSSLEQTASASKDLMEMMVSGFAEERLNIVFLAGGAIRWYLPQILAESTDIYQAGNQGIRRLTDNGQLRNLGDPETLAYFLDYTVNNFPSEHYALIFWDHGEGSVIGVCHDVNFDDDCLSLAEIRNAFQNSPFAEKKLDWIGFDACLMGSAEIAKTLVPYAQYMIASEETEPQNGWDYSFLRTLSKEETPDATGKRIAKQYLDTCREQYPGLFDSAKITMACVDLSGVEAVSDALSQFVASIDVNGESFPSLSRLRRGMTAFGRNEDNAGYDYDLIDLNNMAETLYEFVDAEKADALIRALDECVAVSESSQENCAGLTLYFPFYNKMHFTERMEIYSTLGFSDEYASFVRGFGAQLTGSVSDSWTGIGPTEMEEAHKDNRTLIHLPLSEQQQKEIGAAEIAALQQGTHPEGWWLVALQNAEISPYGSLSGEYIHTNLFVTDESGNPLYAVPLLYTERADGLLTIPLQLTDSEGRQYDARLIGRRDPGTNRVEEEAVYLYDEAIGGYSPRLAAKLSDFTLVSCRAEERKMTRYGNAENGTLRPFSEWEVLSSETYSWTPDGTAQLQFVRDYLDPETLSVSFQITDIYNSVYMSEPVKIRGNNGDGTTAFFLDYDDNQLIMIDKTNFNVMDGMIFLQVRNLADTELRVLIYGVSLNGNELELEEEVWGNGANGGLDPEEEQMVFLPVPSEGDEPLRDVRLEIKLLDPNENEAGKVGVSIRNSGP